MGVDVDQVLAQTEDAPNSEPMHGKTGEVRRNPSTDQKKARRRQDEARLLRTAAVAETLAEQRQALAELEALRTEAMREQDESRALDLITAKIDDVLVPGHVHEMHTAATDWLLELPNSTASRADAEHALIAEADLWYARVDPVIRADAEEFAEQAHNKARYHASQYGEHAEHAANAFLAEASRLVEQELRTGTLQATAGLHAQALQTQMHQLDPDDPDYGKIVTQDVPSLNPPGKVVQPAHEIEHAKVRVPTFVREIVGPMLKGQDVSGLESMTRGVGQQYLSSYGDHLAARSAALSREPDRFPENAEHAAETLFGDDPYDDYARDYAAETHHHAAKTAQGPLIPAEAEALGGEAGGLLGGLGGGGGGGQQGGLMHDLESGLDTSGLAADTQAVGRQYTGAAGAPIPAQLGTQGPPSPPPYAADVDSNRAPALQEMQGYTGFDGESVVEDNTGQAEELNGQTNAHRDVANPPTSFPFKGSHQKESHVTDHAQCPTCGGLGRVAVRKMAYSGLPQVDQIVNADETKGETELPPDVAFPIVGWDPGNVARAISETERIMPSNVQPSTSRRSSLQHDAQGRDNSGWLGDNGAKGLDYPGYSAPSGYDGSSNLGQPDPVYGFGGDEPPGPKLPFGNAEYPDFTNNPGQPYDPTTPHNNDSGAQETGQAMSTGGGMGQTTGSHDPFIAAAQEEIARQQELINLRTSMLASQ